MATYVNRDNLRQLTGLGRDFASVIDTALSEWDRESNGGVTSIMRATIDSCVKTTMLAEDLLLKYDCDKHEFIINHVPNSCEADPYRQHRWLLGIMLTRSDRRNEIILLPLGAVLALTPDLSHLYQVYKHRFMKDANGVAIEKLCYCGVTKRGWRKRWSEHLHAAKSGSHYRFHKAIREWNDIAQSTMHEIVGWGLSESAAMSFEEDLIESETLYPLGLNMIPGGKSGLAYLRKIGALGANERVAPDDRQDIINRFFERATRKGLPNPLAAANWLNPNYAEQVICGGPDRLKPQQIRDARFFSSLGQDAGSIAERVGARNVAQVERMLSGSTYSRVA